MKLYNQFYTTIIVLFLFLLLFFFPQATFAATQSKSLDTIVGNPPLSLHSDIDSAASAAKQMYDACGRGFTYATMSQECIDTSFSSKGFAQDHIQAFSDRRVGNKQKGITSTITGNGCSECLGFVAVSVSLATGETKTLTSGSAADYFGSTSIVIGQTRYDRIEESQKPQPGDLGFGVGGEGIGGAGHALIVQEVPEEAMFWAIESSFPNTCAVTDKSSPTAQKHIRRIYHFFRKVEK